ncbi:MAG: EFR1 family ferrodoxin [Promethearchaeota archaeon]
MKIAIFCFSPTNNTAKIGKEIKNYFENKGIKIKYFDITNKKSREINYELSEFNGIIFGSPIYYWRAPSLMRNWFETLNGDGIKAATFFTYGGVTNGVAHSDTKRILEKKGFNIIASAEFVGKHTYNVAGWNLMLDRPNNDDFKVAKEFAELIYQRFKSNENIDFNPPTKDITERKLNMMEKRLGAAIPIPYRVDDSCSMCLKCEEMCPSGAMNAELGKPDKDLCIKCYRCVSICPENALKVKDMSKQFEFIKNSLNLTDDVLMSRKSRIIS